MKKVVLSLGANVGNCAETLACACGLLAYDVGKITAESSLYETAPWGFESENRFLNQIVILETKLLPDELLQATQTIEKTLGRTEKSHAGIYADRPIDIDIIDYNGEVLTADNLVLPHPLMHKRAFVLQPLCEVWAEWQHPLLHKTAQQLLAEIE